MTLSPSITQVQTDTPEQQQNRADSAAWAQPGKQDVPRYSSTIAPDVVCPCCRGSLIRIWRRPSDRMLGLFVPLHRFRCDAHECRWEGNIRRPRLKRGTAAVVSGGRYDEPQNQLPTAFVVHMALVFIGMVFVFVVSRIEWWATGVNLAADTPWTISEQGVGESAAAIHPSQSDDAKSYLPMER